MSHPSAADIHAIVARLNADDMLSLLSGAAFHTDGVGCKVMAQALLTMLRDAAAARLAAEQATQSLTGRERQVAVLLGAGLSNAEMATRLGCSERTVRAHMENMQRKTGTANRTGLLAVTHGLGIGFSANRQAMIIP